MTKTLLVTDCEGVGPSLAEVLKKERIAELEQLVDVAEEYAATAQEAVEAINEEYLEAQDRNNEAYVALNLLFEELDKLKGSV